jgi:amidophosphoribosyltransferase
LNKFCGACGVRGTYAGAADRGLHEACGVFGVASPPDSSEPAALDTFYALFALQHRGQESCGIAVNNRGVITCRKDIGLVLDVFDKETLDALPGSSAVGHVRYSTTGDSNVENAQPIAVSHIKGNLAIAHNGNLINAGSLRKEIELAGGIFRGTGDSEIIAYTIVRERLNSNSIQEAVQKTMHRIRGAYCILAMSPRKLIAARDPNGFKPLVLGKLGDSYVFASETCAIDAMGGEFIRDVEAGEIIFVEEGKLTSIDSGLEQNPSFCSFEFIYFARPDSVLNGVSVELARRRMGRALARESGVDADIVVAVPDSGISAADGYAEASGLQRVTGLMKNRYIGRTFIQPHQGQREQAVRLKLNPLAANVKDKRVVLIDDSIVRGTTSARIVSALRAAGATEVHLRVSAPPFRYPCYFGTDVPDKDRLIAVGRSEKSIAEKLGADSLAYLKHETLSRILMDEGVVSCTACFSGEYPIELPAEPEVNLFDQPIITLTGK